MTNALPLSGRIYGRLLALYPKGLRSEYADDMALLFAEDLDAARREAGMRGLVRVWRCALWEFLRFALPACASSPGMRVPIISAAFACASLGTELLLHCATRAPARFQTAGMLATFTPILIPVAVIWACRGRAVILLDLSHHPGEEH